jgi:hypothetical protein
VVVEYDGFTPKNHVGTVTGKVLFPSHSTYTVLFLNFGFLIGGYTEIQTAEPCKISNFVETADGDKILLKFKTTSFLLSR